MDGHLGALRRLKAEEAILQAYAIRLAVWGENKDLDSFVRSLRTTPQAPVTIDHDAIADDLAALGIKTITTA